jgi:ankyrin repeat protein
LLIAKGADFNAKTDYGLTALIGASWDGRRDVVQLLLTKGAEVKIKN